MTAILSRLGKVFRSISRFGVSHGCRIGPGLTTNQLIGLCGMNYPNLLRT